jgi:hypothetical protein
VTHRAGLGRVDALLLFVLLGGGWLFVVVALGGAKARGSKTKCSNNLRQLGLAAIQYADDLRYFPHVGPRAQLDGGVDSNATTKIVRALVWHGYHDSPEGFVCPQSYDLHRPIEAADVRTNMRRWFWGGEECGDPAASPFADGLADPILDDTDELSYGWTRRSMNSNARSTALLAADRAQADPAPADDARPGHHGNHFEGVNALQADGTVSWHAAGQEGVERLADLSDEGAGSAGYLAVRPPTNEAPYPGAPTREPFLGRARPGVATTLLPIAGPPAALGVLLLALVLRRAPAFDPKLASARRRGPPSSRVEALGAQHLQAQQRCPLCHDAVRAGEALSGCLDCRAVFHAECVPSGAACPTLGCA